MKASFRIVCVSYVLVCDVIFGDVGLYPYICVIVFFLFAKALNCTCQFVTGLFGFKFFVLYSVHIIII